MKNRKILSAVITAAILVGSVAPSYTVFAESSWTESTAAARAAVEVSTFDALKTAVQTANAQINVTATITVTESIDLNGATLTATGTKSAFGTGMIHITGSNVTISNGTINANDIDTYVVDVSGSTGNMTSNSATLSGVTVLNENLENTGYPSTVTAHSIIRNYGTLTLNNCTVKAGSPAAVKSEEGATLNVRGGSITGKEIGITTYGTTTLSNGTTVSTDSGTNALYVLTYSTYDSVTTVNDATVTGTIVYGADGNASKAPKVEIGAAAVLENSGFTKATNSTMSTVPGGTSLTIDPDASVQLASTTGLDPILINALKDVENITDTTGKSLTVTADGQVVVAVTLSKEPVGYGGLTLTANAGGDVYGVSMIEEQLKALKFSPEDEAIGRGDGYHAGFHVDALDAGKGAASFSYKRATKYLPDVNDATIKGIADFSAGNSTDGQFWIGFQKSWIDGTTEEKPYLAYVVEATYADSSKVYYYIAIDTREIPDDFTFEEPEGPGSCVDNHTADTACPICGNYAKVEVKNTTAADANGSITIKDADGEPVTEAAKNDKITITVTPDEGYVLDKLEINGTAAEVTNNTYTHTMDGVATTIKATFKEIAVTSVTLDEETLALTVGGDKTLTATVLPEDAKDKTVTWSSNKPEIAKVDQTGKITAVAAGEATITATCGTKSATCTVTVKAAEEEKKDETVTLKAGQQKTIVTKTNAAAKTRTENTVLVVPAATAEGYAGVKVTAKAGTWTKTSGLIKTCYAKIVHTDADGVKTTVDAGSDFVIAVEVTDIPDGVTVAYSFEPANE